MMTVDQPSVTSADVQIQISLGTMVLMEKYVALIKERRINIGWVERKQSSGRNSGDWPKESAQEKPAT